MNICKIALLEKSWIAYLLPNIYKPLLKTFSPGKNFYYSVFTFQRQVNFIHKTE